MKGNTMNLATQIAALLMNKTARKSKAGMPLGTSGLDWFSKKIPYRGKQRRRNKRYESTAGIEINRAEGGGKPVVVPTKTHSVTVNTYGRLCCIYDQSLNGFRYQLQTGSDNYASPKDYIDVTDQLNQAEEFLENRRKAQSYKVKSVSWTLDYNRIPASTETIPKLFLWTNTDLVTVINPHQENNTMVLGMNSNGVKNYNTVVNYRNTSSDHTDWQNSLYAWAGKWEIHCSAQDTIFLSRGNQETYYVMGTWKLSIQVLFRETDNIRDVLPTKQPSVIDLENKIKELTMKLQALEKLSENTVVGKEEEEEDKEREEEEIEDKKEVQVKEKNKKDSCTRTIEDLPKKKYKEDGPKSKRTGFLQFGVHPGLKDN